jgi:hypothetical protein
MKVTLKCEGKIYSMRVAPIKNGEGIICDFRVIELTQLDTSSPVTVRNVISMNKHPFGKEAS